MALRLNHRANIEALRQRLAQEVPPTSGFLEALGGLVNESPERETAKQALKNLFEQQGDTHERSSWLIKLGHEKGDLTRDQERSITTMHEKLAKNYNGKGRENEMEDNVLTSLLEGKDDQNRPYALQNLFARGQDDATILHTILYPGTYPHEFHFDRVKPLIRFLLRVHPSLPAVGSTDPKGPPLPAAIMMEGKNSFTPSEKENIIRFLCEDEKDGGLASRAAIKSMTWMVPPYKRSSSSACHAIHMIIETSDFVLSDNVVKKLSEIEIPEGERNNSKKSCLEICDSHGKTCLHIALTGPFNDCKVRWARKLTELCPNLLKTTYKLNRNGKEEQLTPLQHFMEQKLARRRNLKEEDKNDELEDLETFLKLREIFLTLDEETVSWELLDSQKRHYKLDTLLKRVHISDSVSVYWDDKSLETRKMAVGWGCAGSIDLVMVFWWLKKEIKVKKVLEVVVSDGAKTEAATNLSAGERKPHSDKAIIECLKGLGVETLDWQRMDIPAEVIIEGAGKHVKKLYLYCSGLKAVLQSWADSQGLSRLENGLESIDRIKDYAKAFKTNLQDMFKKLNPTKKEPSIICTLAQRKQMAGAESTASKIKGKDEEGFEEQDWLKCMDEFADIMAAVEDSSNSKFQVSSNLVRPIKVALIDDGVKTSYAGLDDNVQIGKSGWQQFDTYKTQTGAARRGYFRNYNSSHTGHGTVMAYYIKRVCPKVHFYVAKLDPQPQRGEIGGRGDRVTFSRRSAAEAIQWAVEEEVDIISMSWAIEKDTTPGAGGDNRLHNAIWKALEQNILLFCANPDRGPSYGKNDTYPKVVDPTRVFCIGAATQDGIPWGRISAQDDSSDYILPGVELGIQVESTSRKNQDDPPREWRKHSGSSLSCALATGLAAMILHCSLVTGVAKIDSPKWNGLRSHEGMRKAFQNIQFGQTGSKWLPVRRFFEPALKYLDGGKNEDKTQAVCNIVEHICEGIRPVTKGVGLEPAPAFCEETSNITMANEDDNDLLFSRVQIEDDTRFDVVLIDNDLFENINGNGAELKSSFVVRGTNLGGGEEQDTRVIDEAISNNALTVQCDITQIIHGTTMEGGSPATLAVFQFAFVAQGERRFKQAEITITFSAGDVQAITPSNTYATLRSEKERELSHSVSPGLEAAFGPGKATMGYTWQLKESMTQESYSKVVGLRRMLGQGNSMNKRTNAVFWGLYENPATESGIPSFLQAAMLLKREKDQKFSVDITICGEVDNRDWVKDKWKSTSKMMTGKSRKGAEIIFNPEKNRGTVDDAKNLTAVVLDTYKQLVTIRPWVDGDERSLERDPAPTKVPEEDPTGQPPLGVSEIAVMSPANLGTTVIGPPDEHPAKDLTQHPRASGTSKESQTDTAPFPSMDSTLVDSKSRGAASTGRAMPLSDDEKQRKLDYLEEQLTLVRKETTLVARLIALAGEEKKILQEINELRG
ncbi:hypothetical protein Hte_007575 [Hypoxylon texense]